MALNIKNVEVERLAGEVATMAHETKTEAVRRALVDRRSRLRARAGKHGGRKSLREYLEQNVWPMMPAGELGRVISREEEDHVLGYGPEGYGGTLRARPIDR
jgi:antitoxin VapB